MRDRRLGKTRECGKPLTSVVTNHKRQREVMPQYFKLRKKVENGRPVRDQPDRLGRPEGRRASTVDRLNDLNFRPSRTSSSLHRRRRVFHAGRSPGSSSPTAPGWPRHGAGPDKGSGSFSTSRRTTRGCPGPRLQRRLPRRTPPAADYDDPRPGQRLGRGRLANVGP